MPHASAYDRFEQPSLLDEIAAYRRRREATGVDPRRVIDLDDVQLVIVPAPGAEPVTLASSLTGQALIDNRGEIVGLRLATETGDYWNVAGNNPLFDLLAASLRITHSAAIAAAVRELMVEREDV